MPKTLQPTEVSMQWKRLPRFSIHCRFFGPFDYLSVFTPLITIIPQLGHFSASCFTVISDSLAAPLAGSKLTVSHAVGFWFFISPLCLKFEFSITVDAIRRPHKSSLPSVLPSWFTWDLRYWIHALELINLLVLLLSGPLGENVHAYGPGRGPMISQEQTLWSTLS